MSDFIPITVAYGDGIGPEITEATIKILKEVEAPIRRIQKTIELIMLIFCLGFVFFSKNRKINITLWICFNIF